MNDQTFKYFMNLKWASGEKGMFLPSILTNNYSA